MKHLEFYMFGRIEDLRKPIGLSGRCLDVTRSQGETLEGDGAASAPTDPRRSAESGGAKRGMTVGCVRSPD